MNLSAIITVNGIPVTYAMAGGKDWGNFTGPGFVQRNVQAALPAPAIAAFEVYFRPDADGSRVEVEFELGKLWGAANAAAANMGSYHVTIKDGDTILSEIDASHHWWQARWRWQSAPRPFIMSPSQAIAAHLLPPISDSAPGKVITDDSFADCVYTEPMSPAGVKQHMPETGERRDIGIITEIGANYIRNPSSAAAARAVLAWGEAGSGSVPWIWRDENTGRPVNLNDHPQVNDEWRQFDEWHQRDPNVQIIGNGSAQLIDANGYNTSGWAIDTAHQPALNYFPALLTMDPYFIEGLSFQATKCFTQTAFWSSGSQAYLNRTEDRSWWWSARTLAEIAKITEMAEALGPLPSWLHPSSYWKGLLEAQRVQFFALFVNNPAVPCSRFFAGPELNAVGTWQHGFRAKVLAHVVELGFAEWRPALEWAIGSQILRVMAFRARTSVYYLSLSTHWAQQWKGAGDGNPAIPDADYLADWKSVLQQSVTLAPDQWAGQAEFDALVADPSHGGTLSPSQSQDYAWEDWSALSYAVYVGVTAAIPALNLLTPLVQNLPRTARNGILSSPDGSIPAPPVNNPPPTTGVLIMPTTFTLSADQTQIPFTVTGLAANGVTPAPLENVSLTADPTSAGSITDNGNGNFIFTKADGFSGAVKIIGHGTDAKGTVIPDGESDGTVTAPLVLATSIIVTPGMPS